MTVDWDYSAADYTCFGESIEPDSSIFSDQYCELIPKHYMVINNINKHIQSKLFSSFNIVIILFYQAMHKCMTETINYSDDIPLL